MSIASSFPNGFGAGLNVRGMPLMQTHPGRVIWLGNASASALTGHKGAANAGRGTFEAPYSTLAYAISQCVAARGDIIMVKPGHAETVSSASALALDKAGVAIIGMGTGAGRPTLTLDTAATATVGISADNVSLANLVVSANFADIVSAITLGAAKWASIEDCSFVATATNMNCLHLIDTNSTTDAAKGLAMRRCKWVEPDAATIAMALVDGTNSEWDISDNFIVNGHATQDIAAMFTIATGKLLTSLRCMRNQVQVTGHASSTAGVFLTTDGTANSGIIAYNNVKHLDATTELFLTANAGFGLFENRMTAVTSTQGYLVPAVDA